MVTICSFPLRKQPLLSPSTLCLLLCQFVTFPCGLHVGCYAQLLLLINIIKSSIDCAHTLIHARIALKLLYLLQSIFDDCRKPYTLLIQKGTLFVHIIVAYYVHARLCCYQTFAWMYTLVRLCTHTCLCIHADLLRGSQKKMMS